MVGLLISVLGWPCGRQSNVQRIVRRLRDQSVHRLGILQSDAADFVQETGRFRGASSRLPPRLTVATARPPLNLRPPKSGRTSDRVQLQVGG